MARKRFYPRSTRPLFPPAAAPVVLTGWMNREPVLPPVPIETPRDFVVLRPFPPIAPPAVPSVGGVFGFVRAPITTPEWRPELLIGSIHRGVFSVPLGLVAFGIQFDEPILRPRVKLDFVDFVPRAQLDIPDFETRLRLDTPSGGP